MPSAHRVAAIRPCERYYVQRMGTCGKPGKYVVHGTRVLCRQCYQSWAAGRQVLFHPGRAPTAAENWAFWERLRADVPARRA